MTIDSGRKTFRLNKQEQFIIQFSLGTIHFMFQKNFPRGIKRKGFTDNEILKLSQKIAFEGE
jgi:hypothetical protein